MTLYLKYLDMWYVLEPAWNLYTDTDTEIHIDIYLY